MKGQKEQELKFDEVYLDANLFIYASIDTEEIGKNARAIIEKVKKGHYKAYTTSLTFDEFIYQINKYNNRETAVEAAELFLKLENLEIISTNMQTIIKMIEVYKETNLKPRDAFHLASMKQKDIKTIISSDPDFDKIKGIKRIDFTKKQ
ncbi:MAG: type II toxin-antitoxin system VapC family toxin [Nanoarchaeota archaeon]|nr:type II toxin-antitoxin system VapC family toxin [Nanoarchaeota archaeon]